MFPETPVLAYPTAGNKPVSFISRSGTLTAKSGVQAEYMSTDQDHRLFIAQNAAGQGRTSRYRSLLKLTRRKVAADPLTSVSEYKEATIHVVIDRPVEGFTEAELLDTWNAFVALLTSSTNANTAKLLRLES